MLIACIYVISLFVAGIDVMQQCLIEAVLVCMIAGALGLALALGFGAVFPMFSSIFRLDYSISSTCDGVRLSTIIGMAFGFLPARSASKLDPIEALARQ